MTRQFLRAVSLAILVASFSAGASEPAPQSAGELEKSLREAMLLPSEYRLSYRDESGAALTVEQLAERLKKGDLFTMEKDDAAKTAILTLEPKPTPASEIGEVTRLPPLDLQDLYGRRVRNLDLAGRPTLINFFFETCVPCIKEAPVLTAYRRRHQEFNYLAVTPDDAEAAKRFMAQRNFDWPVAFEGAPFIEAMKVKGFPTYVLVASDGRILGRGSGMDERDMADPARALGEFEKWVSSRLSR